MCYEVHCTESDMYHSFLVYGTTSNCVNKACEPRSTRIFNSTYNSKKAGILVLFFNKFRGFSLIT